MDDRSDDVGLHASAGLSGTEQRIRGFFDAIRTRCKLEEDESSPLRRDDGVLDTKLREVRAYIDVYLRTEASRRPKFSLLEAQADPNIETRVSVEFSHVIQFYEALALSLNTGGIFIKTESLLPIDSLLEMAVTLKQEKIEFRVSGKVIWVNPRESQGRSTGLGIKFFKLSSIQRQILQDFMEGELEIEALGHLSE